MGALVQALRSKQKSLDSDAFCCLRVFTGAAATRPNSTAAGTSPLRTAIKIGQTVNVLIGITDDGGNDKSLTFRYPIVRAG